MRPATLTSRVLLSLALGLQITFSTSLPAQAAQRLNLNQARTVFFSLSSTDRIRLYLMLIATGDFNAMISDDFGGRLYDAIASFQRSEELPPTGIPDPMTMDRLNAKGGGILRSWGMQFVDHPLVEATLDVPGTFGLISSPTRHGLAFETPTHSMSIDFAFYPLTEASLADIFGRLSTPLPNRHIDFRIIRDSFFAVAAGGDDYGMYSRYMRIPGGSVGFTATWNTTVMPNGNRVAVVMANGLLPSRARTDVEASAPTPAPVPMAPPQEARLETLPPPLSKPVIITGSAFLVSSAGDYVTNNHVIQGCDRVTVTGRGAAHIVAKDAKNDLALLRLDALPAEPTTPAAFRTTPMQLGESVFVLGFPYAGALDNGVNFTSGTISSVAGIDNDTTEFQMTAAVQPGNSGGPVLDASGNLLGVTVARMNDVAVLAATNTVPQNVNFGIKADIAVSFLRVNGVEPKTSSETAVIAPTQIAASGKSFTAQLVCVRRAED